MVIKGLLKSLKGLITPKISPSSDGTSAVQITKADGTTAVVTVDTTNSGVSVAGNISAQNIGWRALTATTDFATTAASTSTITMNADKTATIKAGDALRYKLSGTYYYGRVSAITANLMTIEGVALTTGAGALTELAWKRNGGVASWGPFVFGGDDSLNAVGKRYFAKSSLTATLIATRLPCQGGLRFPLSGNWYLIACEIATTQDDSAASAQPTLQITNDGNNCLTAAKTIPDNTMVTTGITINPTYALFTKGVVLEMSVAAASGGTPAHDAANLSATFFFVQE